VRLRLIYGIDRAVLVWIADHLPTISRDFADTYHAIGVALDGEMIAGVLYSRFTGTNIEMTIASTDARWCSRSTLYYLFAYPFLQLGCRRVTAVTAASARETRVFLERLGFRFEGALREALPEGETAFIFGLLASECRWTRHRRLAPPDPGEPARDRAETLSLAGSDGQRRQRSRRTQPE